MKDVIEAPGTLRPIPFRNEAARLATIHNSAEFAVLELGRIRSDVKRVSDLANQFVPMIRGDHFWDPQFSLELRRLLVAIAVMCEVVPTTIDAAVSDIKRLENAANGVAS